MDVDKYIINYTYGYDKIYCYAKLFIVMINNNYIIMWDDIEI